MTKLLNQPIYRDVVTDRDDRRRREEVRDMNIKEGRVAYADGLPVTACPPFADEDMAVNWRMGWRWAKERR